MHLSPRPLALFCVGLLALTGCGSSGSSGSSASSGRPAREPVPVPAPPAAASQAVGGQAAGKQAASPPEDERATLRRGCDASDADSCARLVHLLAEADAKVDTADALRMAGTGCAVAGADATNREVRAESCEVLGVLLGKMRENEKMALAFRDACELGSAVACSSVKDLEARAETKRKAGAREATAAAPTDVEGANLTMKGIDVDGMRLDNIACRTEGGGLGGLFGGITIAAGFKAKRKQLDACSPKAATETRVKWTGAGGRMTKVKATGSNAAVNACVERALTGAVATTAGTCAASVTHGRK